MDTARLASSLVGSLIDASIAGGLAIALAWMICTHGRLRPRWQALIWWAASLKLLMALAGGPAIPVPVLPATHPPSLGVTKGSTLTASPRPPTLVRSAVTSSEATLPPARSSAGISTRSSGGASLGTRVFAGLWLLGVAVAFVRLGLARLGLRRLRRDAAPADAATVALLEAVAGRAGLRRVPRVVISAAVRAPQTLGAFHPVILLPARVRDCWTYDELRMALSHELAHVRRRDLLWGWVPALAEALFFFHPLAGLAAREYLVARETACDAEAIAATQASAGDYGRLLVRLGIDKGSALHAGGASGSRSVLARRLEMLVRAPRQLSRPAQVALAGLAAVALLPIELAARQTEAPRAVTAAPAAPAPPARPVPVAPAAPSEAPRPVAAAPAAPARPVARAVTVAPAQAAPAAPGDRARPAAVVRAATARPARPVARAVTEAPAPAQTTPAPAPQAVAPTRPDAIVLQKELEAARQEAEERAREATDAAREIRAIEHALQEERARAVRTDKETRDQLLREMESRVARAAELQLEAARDALRAQNLPDARSEEERIRGLQEIARQLDALRANPQAAGASPDDRMQLLREQLELLVTQQHSLLNQQQALAQQQQAIAEAQRRLAEQLAAMRKALDAAR